MNRYTLTAKLNGRTSKMSIMADNDQDATQQAIFEMLDKAHADQSGTWALGEIVLTNPNGEVMQEMQAKA